MRNCLLGLLAAAALLFAACDSQAPSTAPPPSTPAGSAPAASSPAGSAPAGSSIPRASPAVQTARPRGSGGVAPSGGTGSTAAGSPQPSSSVESAEPSASSGSAQPDLTSTSYTFEPAATTGGTLVVGGLTFPSAINPYYATSSADLQTFRAASFNGLLTITGDLRYVPDLAAAVPLLGNGGLVLHGGGMDVTWELKPGMRWSDGQAITCADLEATWKWNVEPSNTGLSGGTAGWRDVSSVEALSDTTCVMHFARVYEGYLGLVSTLLPRHYLQTLPVVLAQGYLYPLTNPAAGVYSGPYVPVEVAGGSRIAFAPNPQWATISGHPPLLKRVEFRLYPDAAALVAAYRSGEIQVAMDLGESDLGRLGAIPLNEVRRTASLAYVALDFNGVTLQARLGDAWQNVVRAIRLVIDRDAIDAGPMSSAVGPTETFVSPLAWYARAPAVPPPPDLPAARQLLDQAGWAAGADGDRTRNGTKLTLELCTTDSPSDTSVAVEVARQLRAIGIAITVVPRPAMPDVYGHWDSVPAGTACNAAHGAFEVLLSDHSATVDPLGGYDAYVSGRIPDNQLHDGRNVSRASLPALDAAYTVVRDSVDLGAIQNAMDVIQDIFASDQNTFELPLFTRTQIWLAAPRLRNFTPNPSPASNSWNIADWWIRASP